MKIIIYPPLSLNEKGKREKNEDSIYPFAQQANTEDNLFLVCDGVGGQAKGEVASKATCRIFAHYFKENKITISTPDIIKDAFETVQQEFDAYIQRNPESKGMATTFVMLHLHEQGATIAHCGDSRCYHFRENTLLYSTLDHNLMGEMVRKGSVTLEEAKAQPKTSRITRAVQGNQAGATEPDIHLITDIQPNDYFLLCSDGVYEVFEEEELTYLVSSPESNEQKINNIQLMCEANAKDNFSAYLIQIEKVAQNVQKQQDTQLEKTVLLENEQLDTPQEQVAINQKNKKEKNNSKGIFKVIGNFLKS